LNLIDKEDGVQLPVDSMLKTLWVQTMKENDYLAIIRELESLRRRQSQDQNSSSSNIPGKLQQQYNGIHNENGVVSKRKHSNSYSNSHRSKSISTDADSEVNSASTEWIHIVGEKE
jgi:hypothetical protein